MGSYILNRYLVTIFSHIFIGEWISGATCMYIANYLVENQDSPRVCSVITIISVCVYLYMII